MISKVVIGSSFKGCCRYVCQDQERSIVLETEGVRGHNHKVMADDFVMQQQLRPGKEQAVFHGILSFPAGEKPSDEKMVEIAKEYLENCGIKNTQYAITKHIDKDHPHMHVIANMVNNAGRSISDSWIGAKARKVSQALTIKHGLQQALSKHIERTNLDALSEYEANKYKIYQTISETLPSCRNLEQLEQQLLKQGIDTVYKYKGQSKELQGVSFKMGEYSYKGSQVDREFSVKKIEKTLEIKQELHLKQELNLHQELRQERSLRQSRGHSLGR